MVSEILKKAAELKGKLVDFSHSPEFNKEFKKGRRIKKSARNGRRRRPIWRSLDPAHFILFQ